MVTTNPITEAFPSPLVMSLTCTRYWMRFRKVPGDRSLTQTAIPYAPKRAMALKSMVRMGAEMAAETIRGTTR